MASLRSNWRLRLEGTWWVAASALLLGCGPSISTLAQQGNIEEAWNRVCERANSDEDTRREELLDPDERSALRQAMRARTAATLEGRAISRNTLHERLGTTLFPSDAVLLQIHITAERHPGWGVRVDPALRLGGTRWLPWSDEHVWKLAEIEPPTAPSLGNYNIVGAVIDGVVAGLTLGTVDPELRGTKDVLPTVSPGNPGTGTPLQNDTLFLLMKTGDGCSSLDPARLDAPCDTTFVLAPKPPPEDPLDPIPLDDPAARVQGDALVLRVTHVSDRHVNHACYLGYDVTIPLPPGADPAARLQGLFDRGPIDLAPPPASPAPTGGQR